MACAKCNKKKVSKNVSLKTVKIAKPCSYTLLELQKLRLKVTNKELPYVTSQINLYSKDCNILKNKIDELLLKYLL